MQGQKLCYKTEETKVSTKKTDERSPNMDFLYGEEKAIQVWQRLEGIDPRLNEEIQKIAYDHYWSFPGLSFKEKSLVTVVSLICGQQEEQVRIHLHGLINLGTTTSELAALMNYICANSPLDSGEKTIVACLAVLREKGCLEEKIEQFKTELITKFFNLLEREKLIITIALASAMGDNDATKGAIVQAIGQGFSVDDVKYIFIHQIVYCGFPTAMNSFSVLSQLIAVQQSEGSEQKKG